MEESGSAAASKPSLKKSYSRRVSFNEDTILPPKEHRRDYGRDLESRISVRPRRRRCGGVCNSCCIWIFLALGLLFFLLILCGGLYYSFLKSHLPDIRLRRLEVGRIDVVTANNDDASVTTNLTVLLDAANGSDKTELIYSKMMASVAASGVQFGVVRLGDVRQPPENTTVVKVAAGVKDAVMDGWAAHDLQSSAEAHVLMIHLNVKGRIDLIVGGRKMNGFPFKIECRSINQSEIDAGHAPPCSIQLASL
ncbi:hypothetical protein C2S53_008582 [Perilla frutescens var. hirtella]|uniref:Late embryogenesis abundant protein LEA-2 subgroup domain-containing protein n=1 Tax=Perilla frutescens var. hirtella TaxID=608512 RepID=A0AAD4JN26_PERFH|nr:hypothetical protein C2S51_024341 [Perilla frutescens var. frutescens]KAH6836870.1 hypothetical protein C2S53_008582 [Perilla frutescens var. hirtella]